MKDKLPYRGWYPIHTACAFGASDKILAEILIGIMSLHVDIPHQFSNITFTDLYGQSPLHIAAASRNLSHVSLCLNSLLTETFLQFAPSLIAAHTSNIPTKCSVIHSAVIGGHNEIVNFLLERFPQALMAIANPCKMIIRHMLERLGHCLNNYSPPPVICELSNGELAVVSCDEVSSLDKPFKHLSLTPLDVACALGRTEITKTLLQAGGIATSLALQIAVFMKYYDIIAMLLFDESTRFIADERNLVHFPISPVIEKHVIQCTEIDLQKNALTALPLCFFQAPLLKHLNVSHNSLSLLPVKEQNKNSSGLSQWGWNCASLEILEFHHNAIHSLPEVLWTIPKMKWLDASHNCLLKISSSIQYNAVLHSIDLSHNQLREVPSFLFSSEEVNLSFNQLYSLPVDLWQSKTIKKLNVSNNLITSLICSNHKAGIFISSLSFANIGTQICNRNSYINVEELDSISALTKLNLSHNKLESFPIDLVCYATYLQHLDVSFNQFGTSHIDISILPPYLEYFSAKECGLSKFGIDVDDPNSQDNTKIHYCFACATETSCLHKVHRALQHLITLNLSGNKLAKMQFVCGTSMTLLYPKLKSLDLSSNELCGDFSANVHLQRYLGCLNLSDNSHLESIPMQLSLLSETLFDLRLANLPKLRDPPYKYHDMPTQSILSYMKLRMQK